MVVGVVFFALACGLSVASRAAKQHTLQYPLGNYAHAYRLSRLSTLFAMGAMVVFGIGLWLMCWIAN
jgi:hypothetical protein